MCKLLQELYSKIEDNFYNGDFGQNFSFPIIYGCEEYSHKVSKISVERGKWNHLTLISGDFSDAYTASSLGDLKDSILYLATIVGWTDDKIELSKSLAELVFENCYFLTPYGILKQSKCFPMGVHSSR